MLTVALTASTLLLAPQATQVRHLHDSASAHSEAGRAVAPAGDWNSDGVDDYAVGAPWVSPDFVGSSDHVGEVQIVSGADGSLLASIPGPSTTLPNYNFGGSVAGPFDFNGNGTAEIAVGSRYGRVAVYEPLPNLPSSATLVQAYEPLDTFSLLFEGFGQTLVNLGDLTGDGRNEIGIGDPLADVLISPFLYDNAGVIQIFDGDGFSLLRTYTPGGLASSGGEFGRAMTRVADMNGNGLGDIAVGAPGSENDSGRVFVFDYSNPGLFSDPLLTSIPASQVGERFGSSLADLGDVFSPFGGGLSELAIGAPAYEKSVVPPISIQTGRVAVVSLETNQVFWERTGSSFDSLGTSLAAVDLDGDGEKTVIVLENDGAEGTPNALVSLDATSGLEDWRLTVPPTSAELGLSGGIDVNQDGVEDLLIGLPNLEFDSGGALVIGEHLGQLGPFDLPFRYYVDANDPQIQFQSIAAAALVVADGSTVLVSEGDYDAVVVDRGLNILGSRFANEPVVVEDLRVQSPSEVAIADLELKSLAVVDCPARVTIANTRVERETVVVSQSPDAAFTGCSILPTSHPTSARRGVVVNAGSSVQFMDCTVRGSVGSLPGNRGGDAIDVAANCAVWLAGSRVEGGAGYPGNPEFFFPGGDGGDAVVVRNGGRLDARGNSMSTLAGGAAGLLGSGLVDGFGVRVEPAGDARVASSLPNLTTTGPVTPTDNAPWIEYFPTVLPGGIAGGYIHAPNGALGVTVMSLQPFKFELPTVFSAPLWVDLNSALFIDTIVGEGLEQGALRIYTVPSNLGLIGTRLHFQGFFFGLDLPGFYTGTNGGAIPITLP